MPNLTVLCVNKSSQPIAAAHVVITAVDSLGIPYIGDWAGYTDTNGKFVQAIAFNVFNPISLTITVTSGLDIGSGSMTFDTWNGDQTTTVQINFNPVGSITDAVSSSWWVLLVIAVIIVLLIFGTSLITKPLKGGYDWIKKQRDERKPKVEQRQASPNYTYT